MSKRSASASVLISGVALASLLLATRAQVEGMPFTLPSISFPSDGHGDDYSSTRESVPIPADLLVGPNSSNYDPETLLRSYIPVRGGGSVSRPVGISGLDVYSIGTLTTGERALFYVEDKLGSGVNNIFVRYIDETGEVKEVVVCFPGNVALGLYLSPNSSISNTGLLPLGEYSAKGSTESTFTFATPAVSLAVEDPETGYKGGAVVDVSTGFIVGGYLQTGGVE